MQFLQVHLFSISTTLFFSFYSSSLDFRAHNYKHALANILLHQKWLHSHKASGLQYELLKQKRQGSLASRTGAYLHFSSFFLLPPPFAYLSKHIAKEKTEDVCSTKVTAQVEPLNSSKDKMMMSWLLRQQERNRKVP